MTLQKHWQNWQGYSTDMWDLLLLTQLPCNESLQDRFNPLPLFQPNSSKQETCLACEQNNQISLYHRGTYNLSSRVSLLRRRANSTTLSVSKPLQNLLLECCLFPEEDFTILWAKVSPGFTFLKENNRHCFNLRVSNF